MKEQMRAIKKYLDYKEMFFHKKDMGYSISQAEYDKFSELRKEALIAKTEIEQESNYIKKILKKVK